MNSKVPRHRGWPVVDENGDFIWRFRLEPDSATSLILGDAFAELFRGQLDEMLKFIVLTYRGEPVRVDGFRFINDPDGNYPIWSTHESASPNRDDDSGGSEG